VKESIMKTSTDLGMNRTGLSAAPALAKQMIRSSHDGLKKPTPESAEAREMRLDYARAAPPIGTVPPPASLKGVATAVLDALSGDKAAVLIDKLAERLAFERMGVRLYDAILRKFDAKGPLPGGPSREELEEIHEDERRHFALVQEAIETMGADPTVQTPSADLEGVASLGLVQILADPRTDLREGLQAILHAEAADRDGWELLISLAEGFEQKELAASFEEALRVEETHLIRVRAWVTALTQKQAFGKSADSAPPQGSAKESATSERSGKRVRSAKPQRAARSQRRVAGSRTPRTRRGSGKPRSTTPRPKQ
jgi:rubrerythrin